MQWWVELVLPVSHTSCPIIHYMILQILLKIFHSITHSTHTALHYTAVQLGHFLSQHAPAQPRACGKRKLPSDVSRTLLNITERFPRAAETLTMGPNNLTATDLLCVHLMKMFQLQKIQNIKWYGEMKINSENVWIYKKISMTVSRKLTKNQWRL
jgi:hypothetical protein